MKGLIFDFSFMIWCNRYHILKTLIITIFLIYCWFFVFHLFRGTYALSTMVETYCFMALIVQSVDIIKNEVTASHQLLKTCLIPMQNEIEKFSHNFIFINSSCDFSVIALSMHVTFLSLSSDKINLIFIAR